MMGIRLHLLARDHGGLAGDRITAGGADPAFAEQSDSVLRQARLIFCVILPISADGPILEPVIIHQQDIVFSCRQGQYLLSGNALSGFCVQLSKIVYHSPAADALRPVDINGAVHHGRYLMCRGVHVGAGMFSHKDRLAVIAIMRVGHSWLNDQRRMCRPTWNVVLQRRRQVDHVKFRQKLH